MKYMGMPMGMWVLMKELGLYDLTPALCHLDYTMSEAGGVTDFVRQYTLASGGPYCDCGYKKKGDRKNTLKGNCRDPSTTPLCHGCCRQRHHYLITAYDKTKGSSARTFVRDGTPLF